VRLVGAEADRPENPDEIACEKLLALGGRKLAALHQIEDVVHPHHVRLGLLACAILVLELRVDGGLPAANLDRARPEAVRKLVEQGLLGHVFLRHQPGLVGHQHQPRHRRQDPVVFGAQDVGEDHLLRALRLAHALVVGQVEGDGLHSGHVVAAAMDLVGDQDRRGEGPVEILVAVLDRKVALHVRKKRLVVRQGRAFARILDGDESLERRLLAVEPVGIDLIRPDHDFDRGSADVHPGQLGFVIIVGPERLGAKVQELAERGVAGPRRRPLEQLRRRLQPLPIFDAVRHRDKTVAPPLHHRIAVGESGLLAGMGGDVGIELGLGQVLRIEAGPGRHRLAAVEGMVLGERVPGPEMEVEHVEQGRLARVGAARDLGADRRVLDRALPQIDGVHQLRRLDQQVDDLALLGAQEGGVRGHLDSRDLGPLGGEVVAVGRLRGPGRLGGAGRAGGGGEQEGGESGVTQLVSPSAQTIGTAAARDTFR
jgi:hypothetical protein